MDTMLNNQIILHTLTANQQILDGYGVMEIGLFGSFASDQQHPNSDIDLLVDIQPAKKTFKNFMALSYYLETILGRKVELVTKQSLSPYIGPHILKTVQYAPFTN